MSDAPDRQSKTEAPTQHRLDEAFDEGQFAQAPEIGMAAVLMAAYTMLLTSGGAAVVSLLEKGESFFTHFANWEVSEDFLAAGLVQIVSVFMAFLAPIALSCAIAAVVAGGMQTQFRITPKVLEPKWSRLNPIQGLQNLLGPAAWVRAGIDLIKFLMVGGLLAFFIRDALDDPIFHFRLSIKDLGDFICGMSLKLLAKLVGLLGLLAALHYLYQKRKLLQDLRMTPQEIKQEQKMMEMSPLVKQARRQMARKLMTRQMLDKIPFADVVVTNPTHYAVALQYEKGKDAAPMVVAKGDNAMALRIIEIARFYGVPKVENRPVARLLYKLCKVGAPIPMDLYHAVAEILAYVYKVHRYYFYRLKARRLQGDV